MGLFQFLQKEWQTWQKVRDLPAFNPNEDKKVEILLDWLRSSDITTRKRGDEIVTKICYSWEGYFTPSFAASVLHALESKEFVRFLPLVSHLADQGARSADQKRVQEAARSCTAVLDEAAKEQNAARTLLRPSDSSQLHTDELLHPAQGAADKSNCGELLRPTQENLKE